jgi:membrane associated rhomboid family serine protease
VVTWTLIAICGAAFVAELVGGSIQFTILGNGPLPPAAALAAVNGPLVARGEVWRLVTASFVHAGVPHLALNMFGLLLAGIFAERIFGHLRTACIFAAGLVGGNVLAASLSSPGAFTLGASGAVLGLFAALFLVWLRFRSQSWLLYVAFPTLAATLIFGLGHAGVSTAGHIGGAMGGLAAALALGPAPWWLERTRAEDAAELTESERQRRAIEAMPPLPREIVEDPANRLVLRQSHWRIALGLGLGGFLYLVGLADAVLVLLILLLRQPPSLTEALGYLFFFAWGPLGVFIIHLARSMRLELSPEGFRIHGLNRFVRWTDVEGFWPTRVPSLSGPSPKVVGYSLTPAAQARRTGLASLSAGGPWQLPLFGMSSKGQAALLESWRQRWTEAVLAQSGGPRRSWSSSEP